MYNFLDSDTGAYAIISLKYWGKGPYYLSVIFKATIMSTEVVSQCPWLLSVLTLKQRGSNMVIEYSE